MKRPAMKKFNTLTDDSPMKTPDNRSPEKDGTFEE
jgi:hypothetical protein